MAEQAEPHSLHQLGSKILELGPNRYITMLISIDYS